MAKQREMFKKLLSLMLFVGVMVASVNLQEFTEDLTEDDPIIYERSSDIANEFAKEYIYFLKTGHESKSLKDLSSKLANMHTLKKLFTTSISDWETKDQFFMCTTCQAVVNIVVHMFRGEDGEFNGPNAQNNAKNLTLELCQRFQLQTGNVCSGLFDINWPTVHYIIMNSKADARSICGLLPISFCAIKQEEFDWSVEVDSKTGPLTKPKADKPQKTQNDLMILHLSDIHYDPDYKEGSLADCEEPLCCRNVDDRNISIDVGAGFWGDYRDCDAPKRLILNAFQHIRTQDQIDYIYYTGDIVPHNIWSTTEESNKEIITEIFDLLSKQFENIKVYPAIGNHEAHPANVFGNENVPTNMSSRWLYEHLWDLWSDWLPAEAKETILKGGYYTVTPRPGFRIISLSNMDCYIFNWWIYYNGNEISLPQLQWLHDTLLDAEENNEHVHILAHIPSGGKDCWPVWAREYNRIIERFSDVISGIFNGHTHKDEMLLHYSELGHPMAISWNGGSLTPYSYKNPNYRIYEIEPKTFQVVDHETWIFNLTEANEQNGLKSPRWFSEYHFSEFTDDLSPSGIDKWLNQMAENPDILQKFWSYKVTLADPNLSTGCNNKCLLNNICQLAVSANNRKERCEELQSILESNVSYALTQHVTRDSLLSVLSNA
uniref:Sphingomyelin phosphodiesterase n=1 Tax=Glossina brevipalpis TaxID=37001 RepID=A0A1A9WB54_9MUSC